MMDTNDPAGKDRPPLLKTALIVAAWLAFAFALGWLAYQAGAWIGEAAAAPVLPSAPKAPALDVLVQPVS